VTFFRPLIQSLAERLLEASCGVEKDRVAFAQRSVTAAGRREKNCAGDFADLFLVIKELNRDTFSIGWPQIENRARAAIAVRRRPVLTSSHAAPRGSVWLMRRQLGLSTLRNL
jgi:hypothetical protein